jgi:hypothetical protein
VDLATAGNEIISILLDEYSAFMCKLDKQKYRVRKFIRKCVLHEYIVYLKISIL